MNSTFKILAQIGAVLITLMGAISGFVIGWHWFGYDFEHHPDWWIMNPEDGGFGQLGAVVTYCGIGTVVGLLVGVATTVLLWRKIAPYPPKTSR